MLDAAITAVALGVTLAQLRHGGFTPGGPVSGQLDPVGAVLAVGATVPLLAWRRFPGGVFVVTAMVSVLLAALGYPVDLPLGPPTIVRALS